MCRECPFGGLRSSEIPDAEAHVWRADGEQAGSGGFVEEPATSVGGASRWWNRQRIYTTCGSFWVTPTSRRPRGTCGVRPCDWLKRWSGWKRQQASLTMPMSGINWRQCAEVFGNIGTLLEQTHRRQTVRGVVPDRNPCFYEEKVVSRPGIEPGTFRLRVCCSAS